jgi:flavin reductase (DIM6/NTAB) family NADH-FMN oxidoreductase RutF
MAPFVKESNVRYALELEEIIPLKQNDTFLVVGSIKDIYIPRVALQPDGFVDLEKAGSLTSLGIDGYYKTSLVKRYSYARPNQDPTELTN